MRTLVAERENNGLYTSIHDLLSRSNLTLKEAKSLVAAGACDGFSNNRFQLGWMLRQARTQHQVVESGDLFLPYETVPDMIGTPNETEVMCMEQEQMGMSPRVHPLALFQVKWAQQRERERWIKARDLVSSAGQNARLLGWRVTWRRTSVHKTGEWMKFMTLEDETATFEVVIFPKVYQKYGQFLTDCGPYLVEGRVDNDRGGITVVAERIENLGSETTVQEIFPS
jgi:DNA polymerase III alpha subunit